MKTDFQKAILSVAVCTTSLLLLGCQPSATPSEGSTTFSQSNVAKRGTYPTSYSRSSAPASSSYTFVVPDDVRNILKRKCYICHGGAEVKAGFDLKQMIYQSERGSNWQPMDLAGVTRIKLAILPLDGKPARMPKRAGSIWNPLTVEEANTVAKWTDYPYER